MPNVTTTKQKRKRRQRGSITAEYIIAGAFEVARATSLDELSMPILAEHLDVAVTSIYWYFHKKEELLNAMTEVAVDKQHRSVPEITEDESWQETLRKQFTALRALHREDEVLSDLVMRTSTYSREATRRTMESWEQTLRKLVDEGLTPDTALLAINALSSYTRGIIIHDRYLRRSGASILDGRQRRLTDWSTLPILDSLIDRHPLSGTTDEDFEFGLSRLISGIEVLVREQARDEAKEVSS